MKSARLFSALAAVAALAGAGQAAAQTQCVTPPPLPVAVEFKAELKPDIPPKPACVDTGKCKKPEGDAYNAAVARYNAESTAWEARRHDLVEKANTYIHALNAYTEAMQAYLNCEHKRIKDQVDAPVIGQGG